MIFQELKLSQYILDQCFADFIFDLQILVLIQHINDKNKF